MKHLLVIEDNKSIASVIEHLGTSAGYEVTVAYSFAEVKNILAKKQDFFIATVDYSLPDAYEGEVIPYVLDHTIPSVIMTGRMDNKIRHKLLKLPIIDYITKENSQAYRYLLKVLHGQLTNHKTKVLVVDDSLSSRQHICRLLKRRNFTVYDEPDGTKALQVLEKNPSIKVLITDQEMPGMSGVELVQTIRKTHPDRDLIIIGCSGVNDHFQSARFIKSGANDFLKKPFCMEEFYCRIVKSIEELQYIEKIKATADSDYLTPLANRRAFIEKMDNDFPDIIQNELAYIFAVLHINNFKEINDNYGQGGGDLVLVELANLLSKHFTSQPLARLGGGKFACLASGLEVEEIAACLTEFQDIVSQHNLSFKEKKITFTISLGGTVVAQQTSAKQWVEQADQALQQAHNKAGAQMVINGLAELSKKKEQLSLA
ncbi:response regulator [Thalassomonas actiniarum]|uniref:Response regulator n=1 Tax=Thalassomonas actiniarum TaxID=485447 RepID=A0AAF0C1N4_9GAMM|nr:response regulator [Thalassomonas actiniarum]WDD97612.1 response regulator [Thalassomonas actiniarum]